MNMLVQHSELVRAALAFILEKRSRSGVSLTMLCDEAGMRFNLSPQDALILEHALARRSGPESAEADGGHDSGSVGASSDGKAPCAGVPRA